MMTLLVQRHDGQSDLEGVEESRLALKGDLPFASKLVPVPVADGKRSENHDDETLGDHGGNETCKTTIRGPNEERRSQGALTRNILGTILAPEASGSKNTTDGPEGDHDCGLDRPLAVADNIVAAIGKDGRNGGGITHVGQEHAKVANGIAWVPGGQATANDTEANEDTNES
jgi:hypothetical protein